MRSGFCRVESCTPEKRGKTHGRCRKDDCSCRWHDEDVKAKAAALVDDGDVEIISFSLPIAMRDAVVELTSAAEHLTNAAAETEMDAVTALRMLHAIRECAREIADVDAALVRLAYLSGEHGDVRIEGLPPAKVQRGRERKDWDSRGAVFDYLERRLADNGGELPEPAVVAEWVLEVVGVSYCRVTPLRAHGLQPKEYCTESPGRISVQFTD